MFLNKSFVWMQQKMHNNCVGLKLRQSAFHETKLDTHESGQRNARCTQRLLGARDSK